MPSWVNRCREGYSDANCVWNDKARRQALRDVFMVQQVWASEWKPDEPLAISNRYTRSSIRPANCLV